MLLTSGRPLISGASCGAVLTWNLMRHPSRSPSPLPTLKRALMPPTRLKKWHGKWLTR